MRVQSQFQRGIYFIIRQETYQEFKYFEIRTGDWRDELGERLDSSGRLLYRSLDLSEKSVEIGRMMLEKQDQMREELGGKMDTSFSTL